MDNLHFSIFALFCAVLLVVVFFKKKRIRNKETENFSGLLIANLIDSFLMTIIVIIGYTSTKFDSIVWILNKLDFISYLIWARCFFLYIYYISFEDNVEKYDSVSKITRIVNIFSLIIIFILPLSLKNDNGVMYSYGLSVNVLYMLCCIYAILIIITLAINIKKLKNKKYTPLFVLVGMIILMLLIRSYNPGLLIIPAVISYIDLIMYFTIENPDIKLLEEIRKAKDKADDLNEDKTDFIFNITSGMKENLNDIDNNIDIISNSKDIEEIKSNVNNIKNIVNSSKILLYKNLNITEQDIKDIELVNNKYNIRNLVKQILYFDKGNKRETLDLRVNVEKSVPDYLYGDSIKLKQILTTILDNSIRHTDKGFIELNINCIKKYEVCRLLITLEDSGRGMSNEMIDDILSKDNLNRKYISKNLDLKSVNKIINLIGGTFSISSKLNVGTKIEITIDQKIVNNNEKKIDNYVDNIKKKKILLVDENIEEIDKTKKILEKYNYYVDTVIWGEQCLNKVRNGERFDLIIMDYDMPKLNGIEVYNRLKKVNNFKIPVVMITDSIDDKVRDKYKDLGIYEVIAKPLTKDKIDNLVKKVNN